MARAVSYDTTAAVDSSCTHHASTEAQGTSEHNKGEPASTVPKRFTGAPTKESQSTVAPFATVTPLQCG